MHPVIWNVVAGYKFCHVTNDKICGNVPEITGHLLLMFKKMPNPEVVLSGNFVHVNDATQI